MSKETNESTLALRENLKKIMKQKIFMAKFPTYPTLLDETQQLSVTALKQWDYLITEKIHHGTITWKIEDEKNGYASIK